MSASSGPKVIADSSLVFAYDMQNSHKSWSGKSTTNVIADAGKNCSIEYSGTSYPFVSQNITTQVQAAWAAGKTKVSMSFEGKRDYSVGGTGGGNDGYPSMYIYFSDWSWASSHGITTYDWSYNHWDNATLPDPTGKSVYFAIYHMNSGNPGKSYARNFQIEFESGASYATPFVNGTRSNTQSILDWTGNNTITATSLTYNSDGSFSFDGSSNYLTISSFVNKPIAAITVEAWIKPTKPTLTGTIRGGAISSTNSMYLGIIDSVDGGATHAMHWANQTSVNRLYNWNGNIPNNAWSHLVGTYDGATTRAYLNGVQIWSAAQTGTIPDATYVIGTYGGALQDGVHNFNGILPSGRIYNRALTADEVKQNFNALRGRYGI